ncbi:helix-turn-helix domain-containing protein [Streptomyces carpinensis]|nr:helix-turn-helix domain-containing protein [Streptomyces carpinensis]
MELNVLGLTADTEHAYTALIGLPRCTASELGGVCGLSASAAGRLLSQLVKYGLATRAAGRPPRFTATAPEVAVTALIQEREHQLDAARSLVQRLAETHREANRISHPDIAVELLTDRGDISAAVHRLTSRARREVRAFDRPPYIDRPGANLETQTQRQRTGVSHRVIYNRAAVAWPGRLHSDILPSVRGGEQARVRADLPLKLVISDDQTAIIPFSLAPGGHSAAYLIHPSPMLVSLEALFEAEWERAVPLRATAPPRVADTAVETVPANPGPAAHVDTERRALLTMLSSGLTDAAIARTQGWSPRTTQRRIHGLMTELGASTRFQAAVMAARRGWL